MWLNVDLSKRINVIVYIPIPTYPNRFWTLYAAKPKTVYPFNYILTCQCIGVTVKPNILVSPHQANQISVYSA